MTGDIRTSFAAEWRGFLATATPDQIEDFIASLAPGEAARLVHSWCLWARPSQLPPGDWRVWLLMAGRGFGKTRAGAEWVRSLAMSRAAGSVALVGDTAEDVRQVIIEGPSGLLSVTPPADRPVWRRSLRRLDWPSGMVARCYSAVDPDQLRGPEFDHAWADEIGKWPYEAAWDNLMLALRAVARPRCLATITPRPRRWLRDLVAAPDTVVVRGASAENEANLAPGFIAAMTSRYGHGALARQELLGEMIEDVPGALWHRRTIERCRAAPPRRSALRRVLVGVDPAIGGPGESGIIIAGRDEGGLIWVLEDVSAALAPAAWAARVCRYGRAAPSGADLDGVQSGRAAPCRVSPDAGGNRRQ